MFLNTILMALRELRANVLRTALSALGMIIGVASVIAVISVIEGVSQRIMKDAQALARNLVVVSPRREPGEDFRIPFKADDAMAIRAGVTGIAEVAPSVADYYIVIANGRETATQVIGTTREMFTIRSWTIAEGRSFTRAETSLGSPVCLLGKTTRAELYGLQSPVGQTLRAGTFSCQIIGVIGKSLSADVDSDADDMVVTPLTAYQRRLANDTAVDRILVTAQTAGQIVPVIRQVRELMRERRGITGDRKSNFTVADIRDQAKRTQRMMTRLGQGVAGVAAISLLVGGIGIMNVMLVTVTERTREIGIRLAVGAQQGDVLLQFVVEAVVLALVGGVVGLALGLVMAWGTGMVIGIPAAITFEAVALGLCIPTLVGVAFGFFPALRASRLDPIEALRHE